MALSLWFAGALAHGPDECPSPATLLPMAQEGGLGPFAHCLTAQDLATPQGRITRFARWCDAAARGSVDAAEGDALLAVIGTSELGADDALWMAEHAATDAAFAGRAAHAALADGARWADPATRADRRLRLVRLLAAADPTFTVTLPAPAPPSAEALTACLDVGAAWAHALWGKAYATERDCLARALVATPSSDPSLARLTVLLAREHPDPAALAAILEAARARFPSEAAFTGEPPAR